MLKINLKVTFSGGTLNFKILKRTADFHLDKQDSMAPVVQSKPLPIPKRSKMFLEQSIRERENAIGSSSFLEAVLIVKIRLLQKSIKVFSRICLDYG